MQRLRIIFFAVLILLSGCSNALVKKEKKHIILPMELCPTEKSEKVLICYINGTCGFCLEKLPVWKKFILGNQLIEKNDLHMMFILYSDNYKLFEFVNDTEIKFPLKLTYDSADNYRILNKIEYGSLFNTVLVNKENEILFTGDPLGNKEDSVKLLNLIHGK